MGHTAYQARFPKLLGNDSPDVPKFDEFFMTGICLHKRSAFADSHEPTVADHIGTQNSGKPAFHTVPFHGSVP